MIVVAHKNISQQSVALNINRKNLKGTNFVHTFLNSLVHCTVALFVCLYCIVLCCIFCVSTQCAYTKYTLQHNAKQTVQRSKKFKKYIQGGMAINSSCEMLHNSSAKKKWRVREVQG